MSVILCTAGYDHIIRFWEALSGICSRTIQHPESQVNRLCITPDKRFVAAAGRHRVYLYDIRSTNPNPVMKFDGHTNNITGVAFHCEGKWMVTSSEDCTVKVWDVRSGTLQRNYTHKAPVNDVVIHPNQGELISGDGSGFIRVWDLGESRCTHQLIPEEDVSVASVSVASDGSLLCAGNNKGNVYLWRMLQNQDETSIVPVATFQAHKDYLTRVLLSPDVKHLATCSADHTAKVWSLDPEYGPAKMAAAAREKAAKEAAQKTAGPASAATSVTASPNGQKAEAIIKTPPKIRTEWNGKGSPASGSVIASGGSTEISTTELTQNDSFVSDQPCSSFLDGPPMDLTTNTLFLETTLASHQRWVWDCAFSADSAYLVTVSSDHCARLWELSSGQIIRQYQGHHRGAVCVALNDYSEPR
ncbi:WD repeat containing protein pop3 [Trichophyton tonsurans CBS 112818]|uniref:WD-repeat protein pop3 n=2 Tax=Trichophyton TaxID=5550 RepID=F2PY22_TRIEC|nr:WD repeat containing protein pop3 [Trichophyton tonsurans CBS 112818]EGE06790.1 WD-repeat protein pop3 [Trichophyton equinum CBS 127.97]